MKEDNPLISCLCVTRAKPLLLERAYTCFREQTYHNKELVIVYENDDELTLDWIKKVDDINVRTVRIERSPETKLGELRNIAINNARGEYVCQWDDDDWYHIGRMEFQYEVIKKTKANGCIMSRWMIFDSTTQKAYISNRRAWEGSLMCKKEVIIEKKYKNQKMGEDTAVVDYLISKKQISIIENIPNLYIYVYHGKNTWNQNHWQFIFKMSQELPLTAAKKIKTILTGKNSVTDSSSTLDKLLNNPIFENYES